MTGAVDTLLALACALRSLQLAERDHPWLSLPLTMGQLKALMLVLQSGGLQSRRLGQRLGIGASAVTPLVDRLVQQKLVKREADPHDRRVIWIRPTARAITLRERVMETNRSVLAEVVAGLPSRERKGVQESLQQLVESAERVLARRQEKTSDAV